MEVVLYTPFVALQIDRIFNGRNPNDFDLSYIVNISVVP